MKLFAILCSGLLLGACAANVYGLRPGEDRLEDVVRAMGQPAMRWQNADGSVQLAYPMGPMGYKTYMVHIGSDGKVHQLDNVMDEKSFARIQAGMTKEEVLRLLGPSFPGWTAYFKARDELVWEWSYCDVWNEGARFHVLFDNSKGTVRSTMSITEAQKGLCGEGSCTCSQ